MIKVFCPKDFMLKYKDQYIFYPSFFSFFEPGNHIFEIASFSSNCYFFYPSFFAKIEVNCTGEIISLSDCFLLEDWGNFNFNLYIQPYYLHNYKKPLILFEESFLQFSVIVEDYFEKTLIVSTEFKKFEFFLPSSFVFLNFSFSSINGEDFFLLKGSASGLDFLLVFTIGEMGAKIVFNCLADNIEIKNNSIITTFNFSDLLKRERINTYIYDETIFKCFSSSFSYKIDKDIYSPLLFPYLFLEGVAARDTNFITSLLSSELIGIEDYIFEFFGDFFSVEKPSYGNFSINTVALKYLCRNTVIVKYFEFDCKENKITNFRAL